MKRRNKSAGDREWPVIQNLQIPWQNSLRYTAQTNKTSQSKSLLTKAKD